MKGPPENLSPEAVALRAAAIDFGNHAGDPAGDDIDSAGKRRNRALLCAALRYAARVVTGLDAGEIRRFAADSIPSWVKFMRSNNHAIGAAIRFYTGERARAGVR